MSRLYSININKYLILLYPLPHSDPVRAALDKLSSATCPHSSARYGLREGHQKPPLMLHILHTPLQTSSLILTEHMQMK